MYHIWKGLKYLKWPWTSLKVVRITTIWYAIYHFLSVVYSNNDSILHHLRDNTTFIVYVILCVPLRNSSVLKKQLKLQAKCACDSCVNILYVTHSTFPKVCESQRFQRAAAKVTFKVTQCHWYWCHLIGHLWFPISLQLQQCFYLALFLKYCALSYFPEYKEVMLSLRQPAYIAQLSMHLGAMCSASWHALGVGFKARSGVRPPSTKDLY